MDVAVTMTLELYGCSVGKNHIDEFILFFCSEGSDGIKYNRSVRRLT